MQCDECLKTCVYCSGEDGDLEELDSEIESLESEQDALKELLKSVTAERDLYRAALNCTLCLGTGTEEDEEFGYTRKCRKCREAREKARRG